MKYGRLIGSAAMALAGLTAVATAQRAEPRQALVMTAHNLSAGDARPSDALRAGDVVRYRLVFTNVTALPVRTVEFTDPVPAGLRYVAGSAGADRSDVTITFSIDGGVTYSPHPMVEEIVEGERVLKPAPLERYTHIRWRVRGSVEPGAQVTAEFRATLPGAAAVRDSAAGR